MPNLIHSMDAANIHWLVRDLLLENPNYVVLMFCIHDCFASLLYRIKDTVIVYIF